MTDKQRGALAATLWIVAVGLAILALYGAWMHDLYSIICFPVLTLVFAAAGYDAWRNKP